MNDKKLVTCPLCGDSNVSWGDTVELKGNDAYEAWSGRGNCLEIKMTCEQNHNFNLCLGFHKGNTYLFCSSDKKMNKSIEFPLSITE